MTTGGRRIREMVEAAGWRLAIGCAVGILVVTAATVLVCRAEPRGEDVAAEISPIPLDGPHAYSVEYLGITCGHMTLESRLEEYQGRPAYHIIVTARNSRFFNKIYKVDGRIDSWVDAETMSTLAYESDVMERGKKKIKRYHIDAEKGVVTAERRGKIREIPYEGEPALDPLAFVYRGRALAEGPGTRFALRILTDHGPADTVTQVGDLKRFRTYNGKRMLLRVQPLPGDAELFSRKGEFVYWIDPGPERTLYRLDFKLGFGRLLAKLKGPVSSEDD